MELNNSQKAFIVLSIFALGGAGIYLYEGSTGYSDDGAGNCYCTSCDDCELALSAVACTTIYLNNSITTGTDTCINNPTNFNGKTIDCNGNFIKGIIHISNYGIYLNGKSGNTIKNCFITQFSEGIRLTSSSNNNISNNMLLTNTRGIRLYIFSDNNSLINNTINQNSNNGITIFSSSNNSVINNTINSNANIGLYISGTSINNTIINNTLNFNQHGIYMYQATDNVLNTNIICSNSIVDIIQSSSVNTGDNNTCFSYTNWNDTGTTGCTNICIGKNQKIICWTNATITETTNNFATATTTIEGEIFTSTSNVTVRFIDIEVDKNKTGNVQYKRKGHYMVYITNTGNETLNITKLYDNIYGNINLSSCSPGTGLVKAGEVITCQFDSNILYTTESNNITVTGSLEGFDVSDWDNETIYVYGSAVCNITALKVANSTRFRCNDSVSYNLSLNNTGVCDFTNLRISDSFSLIQSPYLNCNLSSIPAMVNLSAGEYWSYKYYCTVNCIK